MSDTKRMSFSQIIDMLLEFSKHVPVEIFTLIGSFLEEVVSPIPSPFVLTTSGSLADAQGYAVWLLFWLATIAAIGKTVGAVLLYVVVDKGEDFFMEKFGKKLGITHEDIERIGQSLKKGNRDDIALFLARALPIVPSAPLSIVCGFIKIPFRTYLVTTFFGSIIRGMFYLLLGYFGLSALQEFQAGMDTAESIGKVLFFVILAIATAGFYWKRSQLHKKPIEGKSILSKKDHGPSRSH